MEQVIYNKASTRRGFTPWGLAVRRRLDETGIMQKTLLEELNVKGMNINKGQLSGLLRGLGVDKHQNAIQEISKILDIPYKAQ